MLCFECVCVILCFLCIVLYCIVLCVVVPLPPGTYPLAVNNNNIWCTFMNVRTYNHPRWKPLHPPRSWSGYGPCYFRYQADTSPHHLQPVLQRNLRKTLVNGTRFVKPNILGRGGPSTWYTCGSTSRKGTVFLTVRRHRPASATAVWLHYSKSYNRLPITHYEM